MDNKQTLHNLIDMLPRLVLNPGAGPLTAIRDLTYAKLEKPHSFKTEYVIGVAFPMEGKDTIVIYYALALPMKVAIKLTPNAIDQFVKEGLEEDFSFTTQEYMGKLLKNLMN